MRPRTHKERMRQAKLSLVHAAARPTLSGLSSQFHENSPCERAGPMCRASPFP